MKKAAVEVLLATQCSSRTRNIVVTWVSLECCLEMQKSWALPGPVESELAF